MGSVARVRTIAGAGLLAAAIAVAGCGGSSSKTTTVYNLATSQATIGQTNSTNSKPNAGGSPSANSLSQPISSVAGDTTANLFYIADYANSRILGFTSIPTATNPTANFVLGQPDFTSFAANGGADTPTQTSLAFPTKVWVNNGRLLVADSGNNRVLIWNTLPHATGTPPDVVVGQPDFVSDAAGTSSSSFNFPTSAATANGKLVVVDQGNNRVLIWKTIPTVTPAPVADVVLGQSDFDTGSTETNPTQSNLQNPYDVWTDGIHLLISDTGFNRVLFWQSFPQVTGALPTYVIGQTSFTFSSTTAAAGTVKAPIGVTYNGSYIFVGDTGNNRVLIFNGLPTSSGQSAKAVFGQENFTHVTANDDNGGNTNPQDGTENAGDAATARTLAQPAGVAGLGDLIYVTDQGNSRIQIYAPTAIVAPGSSTAN